MRFVQVHIVDITAGHLWIMTKYRNMILDTGVRERRQHIYRFRVYQKQEILTRSMLHETECVHPSCGQHS